MDQMKYRMLRPGQVLVDYGPITMVISANKEGCPYHTAAVAGAESAIDYFEDLVKFLEIARMPVGRLRPERDGCYPEILQKMISSVRLLEQPDFTPMAAVAGCFSDLVVRRTVDAGADRIFVNNGGDIALFLGNEDQPIRVGILRDLAEGIVTQVVSIGPGDGISGVATSGFGGRSLTKGVASAVTILAENSGLADAAATAVANATDCSDPAVIRCFAQDLDYHTDIFGHIVTKEVRKLSRPSIQAAVTNGLKYAQQLYAQEMIKGALIFVQGAIGVWPPDLEESLITLKKSN
ncbi:UPF0280 family protein [Candidatus Formimonas warabiya]|uniref:Uncharacterized protein n=1 Tax=Formimonas warabiya TaxID=1761012 RepID=A0A3G1KR88_FORW1|nr:hypothetical protein [Candidatus Formimonas warabiya]ATW24992.1 hypothetical protein DCMF_09580 [Candidatus Formimonas warabiya]